MERNNDNDGKPDFSFKKTKKDDKVVDDVKPDFKFKDLSSEIDRVLERKKKKFDPEKEFKIEHISDRIKFAKEVKEHPPEKDFMKIEAKDAEFVVIDEDGNEKHEKAIAIVSEHEEDGKEGLVGKIKKWIALYDGIFSIDLNVDAYWWFVRSCNVFPTILDQGIRTHLDIKKAHEPEKRRHEIPIYLIGLVITGIIFIFLLFNFLFKGG